VRVDWSGGKRAISAIFSVGSLSWVVSEFVSELFEWIGVVCYECVRCRESVIKVPLLG